MILSPRYLFRLFFLLALLLSVAGCQFPVIRTNQWFVAPHGNDRNTCHTSSSPCRLIGTAIGRTRPGDTIYLAEGTYRESIVIPKSLTLSGAHASGAVILDAGGTGQVVNVNCWACYATVVLSDLILRNGQAAAGGGLALDNAQVTLERVAVSGNTADDGGGIYIYPDARLILEQSSVAENRALSTSGQGGGIYNTGELRLESSTLVGNTSAGEGGGIYNAASGVLSVLASSLTNNRANAGAGLFNDGGQATLEGVTLYHNVAVQEGGGLYNRNNASTTLVNATLSGNVANQGAGLANAAYLSMTNVTIAENNAQAGGGGIYLFEAGSADLTNTLLANNVVDNCAGGSLDGEGHNLSSDSTCRFAGKGNLPATDPLLGFLAENGGLTWTHALLEGSPAIDAGATQTDFATDQRGETRPMDGDQDGRKAWDIGALEFSWEALATQQAASEPASTPTHQVVVPFLFTLSMPANCRTGPGIVYRVLTSGEAGSTFLVIARNEENTWFFVNYPGGYRCWFLSTTGVLNTDPLRLPVERDPPTPTVTPWSSPEQ